MVTELVHEDVRGKGVVGGHRAVEVVDTAAAVGAAVDHDLDHVVRRKRRQAPERAVVEGEHVAFRAEGVVGRADRVAAVHAQRRPRDAGLASRRHEAPHVEVLAAFLERRGLEQDGHEAAGVGLELAPFGGGVAVAEQQQIDLVRRIAVALQGQDLAGAGVGHGRAHEHVLWIHGGRPHRRPLIAGAALADLHGDRRGRRGEAQRLVEGARDGRRLLGRDPLVVDRAEAARVEQGLGGRITDVEPVGAQVQDVARLARHPRPGRRLDRDLIEGEEFLPAVAGVEVVHAHGAGHRGSGGCRRRALTMRREPQAGTDQRTRQGEADTHAPMVAELPSAMLRAGVVTACVVLGSVTVRVQPRPVFEPLQPDLFAAGANLVNAFADIDGDGDLDLFVGFDGAPNRLYRNDGGTFTDVAVGSRRGRRAGHARGGVGRCRCRRRCGSAARLHPWAGRPGAAPLSQRARRVRRRDGDRGSHRGDRGGAPAGVRGCGWRRRPRFVRGLPRSPQRAVQERAWHLHRGGRGTGFGRPAQDRGRGVVRRR